MLLTGVNFHFETLITHFRSAGVNGKRENFIYRGEILDNYGSIYFSRISTGNKFSMKHLDIISSILFDY